ncbi:MAG: hypothetical protein MJK18_05275, partial [Bdellovibrionales bacterium]|nr:hypothetical protein [Bdellovibrionales bacterium]
MNSLGLIIFISLMSFGSQANERLLQPSETHHIVLPARYEQFRRQQQEDSQLIPENAKDARSAEAFVSSVLGFHFDRYLKNNPNSSLSRVKNMEQSINNQTRWESENFKIQPKLSIAQMKAQVDIESVINSKIWLDNSFRTFNAQVEIYRLEQGEVALQYRSDNDESKTVLGYKQS